jgi:chromatin structure-remodeling complex subunit RSC4
MSKREHGKMNGFGESDGTRHKRRRDVGGSSSDVDMSDPTVEEFKTGELVDVKEDGLRLWQTVKDAVNKE